MATAILILISFVEVPSLLKVDPKYFESVYFLKVLTIHHDGNGDVLVGIVDKYFGVYKIKINCSNLPVLRNMSVLRCG